MLSHPLYVVGVLCLMIYASEWLVERTWCRHLGTALLVILLTAVLANLGLVPSASNATPLYDGIFTYVAPLAIFFLLLEVNLRNLRQAGPAMLGMFGVGAAGTVAGVLAGMAAVGKTSIGPLQHAIGGMFTGTYIGGSINFNAVALHYEVQKQADLYAGSVAVDNIVTTVWMIATLALPQMLHRAWPRRPAAVEAQAEEIAPVHVEDETETVNPLQLGALIALGAFAVWLSDLGAAWFAERGLTVPSILILTTFGIALAQVKVIHEIPGSRLLGMFSVYVFLAVIGAYCELGALAGIGRLGTALLVFASVLVLVHGLVTFAAGALLRQDWTLVAVASQCNVGGGTSALALARSLGRPDLVLPAILMGSLGNGLGTYAGFLVAGFLAG